MALVGTERVGVVSSVMRRRLTRVGLHDVAQVFVISERSCVRRFVAAELSQSSTRIRLPLSLSLARDYTKNLQAPAQYEDTCDASCLGPGMKTPNRRAACPDSYPRASAPPSASTSAP